MNFFQNNLINIIVNTYNGDLRMSTLKRITENERIIVHFAAVVRHKVSYTDEQLKSYNLKYEKAEDVQGGFPILPEYKIQKNAHIDTTLSES